MSKFRVIIFHESMFDIAMAGMKYMEADLSSTGFLAEAKNTETVMEGMQEQWDEAIDAVEVIDEVEKNREGG
jgi:hypothetical protein